MPMAFTLITCKADNIENLEDVEIDISYKQHSRKLKSNSQLKIQLLSKCQYKSIYWSGHIGEHSTRSIPTPPPQLMLYITEMLCEQASMKFKHPFLQNTRGKE